MIKTKEINIIDEYINYNNKINDYLYSLFKILLNTFKVTRTLTNYLNLSHFSYFTKPFEISINNKKDYKKYKKCNILHLFYEYCQFKFFIPIHSNHKHFSLVKEIKLNGQRYEKLVAHRNLRNLEDFNKGYLVRHSTFKEIVYSEKSLSYPLMFIPSRVSRVCLLNDQRLAIVFSYTYSICVYSFDIKLNVFSLNLTINYQSEICYFFQRKDSLIVVIDMENNLFGLKVYQNWYEQVFTYKDIICYVELDYPKVLLLGVNGIYLKKWDEHYKDETLNYNNSLYYCRFGYQMSNGLLLLNKVDNILFVNNNLNCVSTIKNKILYRIEIGSENIEKKKFYCQKESNVIIINTQTLQIESIYKTSFFYFYPIFNTKYDLMSSFFEKINYNTSKLSDLMLFHEPKELFQISNNLLFVSTPNQFFCYTIE